MGRSKGRSRGGGAAILTRINENEVTGFLKAEGKKLVNGEGREIVLRGVGFGSWMLPEGYMWRFPNQGDRPRRIEQMVIDLIGEEKANQFWAMYYDRYISEDDIRQIAAEGFNSVRVPISARFLLEEGEPTRCKNTSLALIDRVIAWCRTYRLYVILDLHGAPGGQTGTNIDDSEHDIPELFTVERNKRLTVELWKMLATRYKDEWIVAGYDLLNEPLPEWFSAYNNQVMPLYRDIVQAIREVDDQHMIILEGVHWSTDWSIFDDKIDHNLMLQFHKYWNNPDTESIQTYLDKSEAWQVPIFMGEGGENNKDWYAGAFRLFEDHDISWNFWTWKKMDTTNSPCSVKMPEKWKLLVNYLEEDVRPDAETAQGILWEYLNNLSFDQCDYHADVVCSLFRRSPVRIPAIFYGYRGEGESFGIAQRLDRSDRNIGYRISDGTDIRFVEEGVRKVANFQHGRGEEWQSDERMCVQLAADDWLSYEFTVVSSPETSLYCIALNLLALEESGQVTISVDGTPVGIIVVSENVWTTATLKVTFPLASGLHRIDLKAEENPIRVEWVEIRRGNYDE